MYLRKLDDEKLALYGDKPIRVKAWPTYDKGNVILDKEDEKQVVNVIRSNRLFRYDNRAYEETEVGKFEILLQDFFHVKHALAVSSGTAALTLPLLALGLPPGSYVGCPTFSFTATASAIIQANLKPLLIEVDSNLHIDMNDLEKKISQMKALVIVHMRGFPAPLPQILEIAARFDVPIIEDSVPTLGHQLNGKYLGTFGLAGGFSTQSDKSLDTGEGGFILTNNKDIYQKCIILSGAFEYFLEKHFLNEIFSFDTCSLPVFNFRLDEIRGALGSSQLKKLNTRLSLLFHNYEYIIQGIANLKYIRPRGTWHDSARPMGDNLLIKVEGSVENCCWFAEAMTAEGIDTKALGNPHKINVRRFWDWKYLFAGKSHQEIVDLFPASFQHISSYIDIPLSPTLIKSDLEDCINAFQKVHHYYEHRISFK